MINLAAHGVKYAAKQCWDILLITFPHPKYLHMLSIPMIFKTTVENVPWICATQNQPFRGYVKPRQMLTQVMQYNVQDHHRWTHLRTQAVHDWNRRKTYTLWISIAYILNIWIILSHSCCILGEYGWVIKHKSEELESELAMSLL